MTRSVRSWNLNFGVNWKYTFKRLFQGARTRRDAIRNKEKYKWMQHFYPAIFWTEYKVLLLSVKKLMARNISLVEPSFDCLSERMLKNKIVCIDEFDASRSVILDSLIDRALDLRADYLQLFLQVYRGATTIKYPVNWRRSERLMRLVAR